MMRLIRLLLGTRPDRAARPTADAAPSERGGATGEAAATPPPSVPLGKPDAEQENPYLAGRRAFVDRYMDLAKGKRNWQIAAFAALGLLATVTLAYIRLASTARVTPYVVEVDALGQAKAFGPAERMEKASARLTASQLALFVRNLRSVYPDPLAQKEMVERAYAFAGESVEAWLNAYFARPEHDPRLLGRRFTRRVDVQSVLAVPESRSWKVTWVEVETPRGSEGTERRSAWEAYLTVEEVPPTSAATIEANPLGLYVTAINWTELSPSS